MISSEDERIRQLSERIYEIEADVMRPELVVQHLADDQTFDLLRTRVTQVQRLTPA